MLPNLSRMGFQLSMPDHATQLATGPPASQSAIEKQQRREIERAERARQKALADAVEKQRKSVLNEAIRVARAEVKNRPPMDPSLYGLAPGESGVTVIPFADAAQLDALRESLRDSFNASPEFKPGGVYGPSTFDNDAFVPVEGGFAGMATPSSFHNDFVRSVRMAAHVAVLSSNTIPIANDCAFEQVADRLMVRRSHKTPGAEMWHRDAATFAQDGDVVYGGWLNLDRHAPQYFSMCPGTANEVQDGRNYGFEPIPDTDAPFNIRRSVRIEIPPGHIMIFNEKTIHEVLAVSSPPGVTKSRLFFGWRTTRSTDPITPNLAARLLDQEALPLKSGQHAHKNPPPGANALMRSIVGAARFDLKPTNYKYPGPPPMWSTMHRTNTAGAKLLENLGTHFKDAVLVTGGYRFQNPTGELGRAYPPPLFLQTVPQFLPSLRELAARDPSISMYPAYTNAELSILWPRTDWPSLLSIRGRRVAIRLEETSNGYKRVLVEEQ